MALSRISIRIFIGDHFGVAHQHGVNHAKASGPQCPTCLGDINDAISNVGNLGFGRTVRQTYVGLDSAFGEITLGQIWILRTDAHTMRQVGDTLGRAITSNGYDNLDGIGRRL